MNAVNPVAKGMAEIKFQRLERFKIQFSSTPDFELLNEQFQPFEIFKMNGEKFAITTVQQAFEVWVKELKPSSRACFIKDLDKLISGDYVLVPKEPTAEMERAGMAAGGGFLTITIFKTMIKAAQGVSL